MSGPQRVAVVGSGIAGLAVASRLSEASADVTLFEAAGYFGGHTHTVDVELPAPGGTIVRHGIDTGFLVFNHRTYPQLVALFERLGVETVASEMSFSVQAPASAAWSRGLEWSGCDLNTVFAQRSNLLRPRFLRMLADIARFNRLATGIAERGEEAEQAEAIGDFLARHRFGDAFREGYFLPMIGCIWSCPTDQMLRFPVATLIRFCHNHGLIQVTARPQWYTVRGGARHYVDKLVAQVGDARLNAPVRRVERHAGGVDVVTDAGSETFDQLVLACHSDQSLALLAEAASHDERDVLGAIRYHPNRAVLHTDDGVLPRRRLAWAAWNYERSAQAEREQTGVCLHYLINRLQPLPFEAPVIVSLNPAREPDPRKVLGHYEYSHPIFDLAAIRAQRALPSIQGRHRTWFCGAWTGYGFHEDGLKSGLAAADSLIARSRDTADAVPDEASRRVAA